MRRDNSFVWSASNTDSSCCRDKTQERHFYLFLLNKNKKLRPCWRWSRHGTWTRGCTRLGRILRPRDILPRPMTSHLSACCCTQLVLHCLPGNKISLCSKSYFMCILLGQSFTRAYLLIHTQTSNIIAWVCVNIGPELRPSLTTHHSTYTKISIF